MSTGVTLLGLLLWAGTYSAPEACLERVKAVLREATETTGEHLRLPDGKNTWRINPVVIDEAYKLLKEEMSKGWHPCGSVK